MVIATVDRALKAIDEYVSKYATNECGWTEKGRIHFERGEYTQALGVHVITQERKR
jgi:hypothetical protein